MSFFLIYSKRGLLPNCIVIEMSFQKVSFCEGRDIIKFKITINTNWIKRHLIPMIIKLDKLYLAM